MYAFLFRNGERLYTEVEDPQIKSDDEVIVRVMSCGVCGSDINKFKAKNLPNGYLKTEILGHEIAGIVEDTRSFVRDYERGDRVVVKPIISCGSCKPCKEGRYQFCDSGKTIGRDLNGGFAQYVPVPSSNIRRIDNELPFSLAVLVDPIACAVHCLNLGYNGRLNDARLGIIGDGSIALSCLYAAINLGYRDITVFGRHEENLEVARKMGANTFLSIQEPQNQVFNTIIETVGRSQSDTMKRASEMVDIRGKVVIAGVFDHGYEGCFPFREIGWKEAELIGSNSYCMHNGVDEFDIALKMMQADPSMLKEIITHEFPLEQMNEAIDTLMNKGGKRVIKVVIIPNRDFYD